MKAFEFVPILVASLSKGYKIISPTHKIPHRLHFNFFISSHIQLFSKGFLPTYSLSSMDDSPNQQNVMFFVLFLVASLFSLPLIHQWGGKKIGEESLWTFPSKIPTFLIFASHQWSCCSFIISALLKTLDTTFRSIRPIKISISSSTPIFRFLLKHFPARRRCLSFFVFCKFFSKGLLFWVKE